MPARRTRQPPTAWQHAKPHVEAALGASLVARGFDSRAEAMSFWRRRSDFRDVVQLRSKYGTACNAYFGCHPIGVRESVPSECFCIFRTSAREEFRFSTDVVEIPAFVERELVPAVVQVVDTWFPRFESLEKAFVMLEGQSQEFDSYNKGSQAYEHAVLELTECIRRKAEKRI